MRLLSIAALLLGTLLAGTAGAQPLAPPGGPVVDIYVDQPVAPRADCKQQGDRPRKHGKHGKRKLSPALRAALIEQFDRDGDGRLTGPEKKQAKKFVKQQRKQHRQHRQDERQGF